MSQFDQQAGKYRRADSVRDKRYHHEYEGGNEFLSPQYVEEVLQNIGLKQNSLKLDIGGGSGEVAAVLDKLYGGKTLVTDVSSAGLSFIAHDSKVQAEASRQPLPDASFDFIHSKDVFVHLADPASTLHEIYRLLKPGGKAVITFWEEKETGMTLYYGVERNEKVDVPFSTKDEYDQILQRLKQGAPDTEFWDLRAQKKENFINGSQAVVSVSPPYFRITKEDFVRKCEEAGLIITQISEYSPDHQMTEWVIKPRNVFYLEKPHSSVQD